MKITKKYIVLYNSLLVSLTLKHQERQETAGKIKELTQIILNKEKVEI